MMQSLQFIGYCVLVSAVLTLGAIALENAARATGRAGRWAWVTALLGSIALPIVSFLRPYHVTVPDFALSTVTVGSVAVAPSVTVAAASAPLHTGTILWATASLLVFLFVGVCYARLSAARRKWSAVNVDGVDVWLSDNTGPAALGIVRTGIVLPRWVLSLGARARTLMLLHEREHIRAWDPRLMLASLGIAALVPWNPCGWYMVRRLRLAIELDCDARVLARDPDPVAYGAVLLEVSRRRTSSTFALATFAEPRSQLERRIRRMAEWPGHRHALRGVALAGLALSLTGAAYAVRGPVHARIIADMPAEKAAAMLTDVPLRVGVAESSVAPQAGDTVKPKLINGVEVSQRVARLRAVEPKTAAMRDTIRYHVYISATGTIDRGRIKPMAAPETEWSALMKGIEIIELMKFAPATLNGRRVPMWIDVVVPFGAGNSNPRVGVTEPPRPRLKQNPPTVVKFVPLRVPTIKPTATIQGRVMTSGNPVAYAQVFIPGTRLGNITDENGEYVIHGVTPGSVTVRVSGMGYRAIEITTQTDANSTTTSNFQLEPSAVDLSPLTTDFDPNAVDVLPSVKPPLPATPRTAARSISRTAPGIAASPVFTPMSIPPKLLNAVEVQKAILKFYPPLLREAGIGGKTKVWFFIDENGRSIKQLINTPSGYDALDQAALRVAPILRFSPAMNQDHMVPVWVAIDIIFKLPVEN